MKILLVVLDGWGLRNDKKGNAIKLAKTPNFDKLWKKYPHTTLEASGEYVGLPKRNLGGSEVGHLHIGAGRIIKQKLTQINDSIKEGSLKKKKHLKNVLSKCKKNGSSIHFMGLLSEAGIHSDMRHLLAMIEMARKTGLKKEQLKVHCFLDGRDTPPKEAKKYLKKLSSKHCTISTISGRYYSMDRDKRWDRTKKAFNSIVAGKGPGKECWEKALKDAYRKGETDEFVKPVKIGDYGGFEKNDTVVTFNFRPDRMRQLVSLLLEDKIEVVTMTQYSKNLKTKVLFPPDYVKNSLGEILSKYGLKQLRIAESEKGPHVTYFFSGQREKPFKGEKRIIVPSPKVSTYDKKPEMSAKKVTKELLSEMGKYDFVVLNFANGDMVGHTGILKAGIKAVETIDECLGNIVEAFSDYIILVTADHGNCEDMRKKGDSNTAHTLNRVPFIIVSEKYKNKRLKKGGLSNIAPTVLKLMKIKKPREMGKSLL